MKRSFSQSKGFTLVELMVATSIFMIIMLMAVGALVVTSSGAKKAQALRTAMDNINFAMDSMARSLRTGTDFSCIPTGAVSLPAATNADCASGGGAVAFTSSDFPNACAIVSGSPVDSDNCRGIAYVLVDRPNSADDGGPLTHTIQKCKTGSPCVDIVSSGVDIQELKFFVRGSDMDDDIQPSVYIKMKGTVLVRDEPVSFALQTIASQRSSE